jgi:hypothetical protein
MIEIFARQPGEALCAELGAVTDVSGQLHSFTAGELFQLAVHPSVFLDHFLAEPLQFRVRCPLRAKLAKCELGKTTICGRRREQSVIHGRSDAFLRFAWRLIPALPAFTDRILTNYGGSDK